MNPQNKISPDDLDKLLPIAHVEHKEVFKAGNITKLIAAVIATLIIITSLITVFLVSSLKTKIDQRNQNKITKNTKVVTPSQKSQNSSAEVTFKSFTNNTYNYSIEYPQSWAIAQTLNQQSPEKQDMSISFLNENKKNLIINAYSIGKFNNVPLLEFIDIITSPINSRTVSNQEDFEIGELSGLKQNIDFQEATLTSGTWYAAKNCDYYFTFIVPKDSSTENVESALSTFEATCNTNSSANGF
ncbi:hypothetical protein M1349_00810 [Patescibacteria group bacterium]|nr:hypothetical protein [Patescibacteria group bacterium]